MACLLKSAWKKIEDILETNPCKDLALVGVGAVASVIGSILVQSILFNERINLSTWIFVVLLMALLCFLIFYGSGGCSKWWHNRNIRKRILRPKVGILNDMEWDLTDEEIYTNTDISPGDWQKEMKELSGNKIPADLINTKDNFDMYNAIINPYGGVYPEFDLENFKTMNKILNYMKDGGLFINVADIPGFFACNPSIKPWRRVVTAQKDAPYAYVQQNNKLIKPIAQIPLFHLTPFTRELGVDIYTTEFSEKGFLEFELGDLKIEVHRVAVVKGYIVPKIKRGVSDLPTLSPRGENILVTPLFFAKYGDGKLLSSLIFEKQEQNERLRKELKKMLGKLIIDFIDP